MTGSGDLSCRGRGVKAGEQHRLPGGGEASARALIHIAGRCYLRRKGGDTPGAQCYAAMTLLSGALARAAVALLEDISRWGGRVKIEDLLGRHVKYKGEEGRVVEGHAGEQASVVVSIRRASRSSRRDVTVPESEWEELEILG